MADLRPKRIAEFIEPLRVEPGRKVRLPNEFDPSFSHDLQKDEPTMCSSAASSCSRSTRSACTPRTRLACW